MADMERALRLIERAETIYRNRIDDVLETLTKEIGAFDGLPVAFNPFGVLELASFELVHTKMLTWLLDPTADHGLDDFMLRRLLVRTDRPRCKAIARSEAPLRAALRTEVKARAGFIDLVVLVDDAVLPVEVKVGSVEASFQSPNGARPQCQAYRECMEDAEQRTEALRVFPPAARAGLGATPEVVSIFLRKSGAAASADANTVSVGWLDIDADLSRALQRRSIEPERRALLIAFRSTLLEGSGSVQPRLAEVDAMRRWVDFPELAHQHPVRAAVELESFRISDEEVNP
jgi:hypothetical protein